MYKRGIEIIAARESARAAAGERKWSTHTHEESAWRGRTDGRHPLQKLFHPHSHAESKALRQPSRAGEALFLVLQDFALSCRANKVSLSRNVQVSSAISIRRWFTRRKLLIKAAVPQHPVWWVRWERRLLRFACKCARGRSAKVREKIMCGVRGSCV